MSEPISLDEWLDQWEAEVEAGQSRRGYSEMGALLQGA